MTVTDAPIISVRELHSILYRENVNTYVVPNTNRSVLYYETYFK